jgi:hypothetical protein
VAITSISASFNTNSDPSLVGSITVTAELYVSNDGGLQYTPLPGTLVTLPGGSVDITSGTAAVPNVVIPANDLAVVVFAVTAGGIVGGSATAGVSYTSSG